MNCHNSQQTTLLNYCYISVIQLDQLLVSLKTSHEILTWAHQFSLVFKEKKSFRKRLNARLNAPEILSSALELTKGVNVSIHLTLDGTEKQVQG